MSIQKNKSSSIGFLQIISVFLISAYIIINTVFIYYVGAYAWDDGSITLAYGQTIGNCGKFALTGASEIVEGSSSIVLTFMAAVVTKILHLDFYEIITWSQINTLIFAVITFVLTHKILKPMFQNKSYALLITSLIALFPMYTIEIMNGMEMTIFSVLLLLFVISFEQKSKWLYLVIPLLLLTRFETIFYIIFALSALFLFNKNERRYIFHIIIYTLLLFIIFSLLRYVYFGDFMPNTIWAKLNPPYSYPDFIGKIYKKIAGGIEFLTVFNLVFIGIFLFLVKKNKEKEIYDIKLWLILSFFAFSLIAGKNWGYSGRMFLAILPIMVIFLTSQVLGLVNIKIQIVNETREWIFSEKSRFYMMVSILSMALVLNSMLFIDNVKTALIGGFHQNRYLPSIINKKLAAKYSNNISFGVTPENYRITGLAVDEARKSLNLDVIKFMVPDVGGLGLCCEKINVIDSALLTNSFLAKNGYEKFEKLLMSENPDIIETHGIWSKVTDIYSSNYFKNNYVPIILNETFFWLNKKYIGDFSKNANIKVEEILRLDLPGNTRYLGDQIDEQFIEEYKGYFYLITYKEKL